MIQILFYILLALLAIPTVMFIFECTLGLFPARRYKSYEDTESTKQSAVILIPAHNEESVISHTLKNLQGHVNETDQVIVIADNCQDKTAQIVRDHGFTAIERKSENERGKGYALAFGMEYLKQQDSQPEIVVIVDADCLLADEALAILKREVQKRGRPVQACYLMLSGEITRLGVKVSEFAFMVKNKIRLRGLSRLGMPVPLTGTGMAFPWQAIANAQLATGDIVEDMRLGVELAEHGMGATYCDAAQVYSFFPANEDAERTQRERWEHGHLSTLCQFAPRLLKRAITKPSIEALGMMIDLVIPPLSLLVMIIGAVWSFFLAWAILFSDWIYLTISSVYLAGLLFTILVTWFFHGRSILSFGALIYIPVYIVSKIVIYIGYIIRKQTKWIRTDRN